MSGLVKAVGWGGVFPKNMFKKNVASEQICVTQHDVLAFPGAMLSPLLLLVGGCHVSVQEDHPLGVVVHI